ncbi:MAG: hypothetical protein R3C56_06915 [Pirellulaceae bacterium]
MTPVERFDPDFANDVIDATLYYDAISAALGNRFRDALRDTLREVRQRPLSFGFTRQPSQCDAAQVSLCRDFSRDGNVVDLRQLLFVI